MSDRPHMSAPPLNLTEHAAAQRAVVYLRADDSEGALHLLREVLVQREPPPDAASDLNGRLRLRAYIGQAIIEIVEGFPIDALRTLEQGVEGGGD
jgi:hypothetical protein